jgi:lipopolysaccharide transport protein LptA
MTQSRLARPFERGLTCARSALRVALLCGVMMLLVGSLGAPLKAASAAGSLRIAVAPFAGESANARISVSLAGQLEAYDLGRVMKPGTFIAAPIFEPSAEELRRWAYNAAVEYIVVGRVKAEAGSGVGGERGALQRVEVVVNSGHSGVEVVRHSAVISSSSDADGVARQLASEILEGLGYSDPAEGSGPTLAEHVVGDGTRPGARYAVGSGSKGGLGLDSSLDLEGFKDDAPIEIKADEAEIINRGGSRRVIFQRNVLVRQSNVVLKSDRLEALYGEGDSKPERLDARGRVFVDQAGRQARCDHAVYLRDSQELTCEGHAELVQGCDIVRGNSIKFNLAKDRARVEGAASIVIRSEGTPGELCGPVGGVL